MKELRHALGAKVPLPSALTFHRARLGRVARVELLADEAGRELARISQLIELPPRAVIYPEGKQTRWLYNLISGAVKTCHILPDGQCCITTFLFSGDFVGLSEQGAYVGSAEALTPVVAYKIPRRELRNSLRHHSGLALALLYKLRGDLQQAEDHLVLTSRRDARTRLAAFMLWILDRQGDSRGDAPCIRIPMLQKDIADYLGLTVETVSRALQQLMTAGHVRREGGRAFRLTDMAGLRRLVHGLDGSDAMDAAVSPPGFGVLSIAGGREAPHVRGQRQS